MYLTDCLKPRRVWFEKARLQAEHANCVQGKVVTSLVRVGQSVSNRLTNPQTWKPCLFKMLLVVAAHRTLEARQQMLP